MPRKHGGTAKASCWATPGRNSIRWHGRAHMAFAWLEGSRLGTVDPFFCQTGPNQSVWWTERVRALIQEAVLEGFHAGAQ